MTMKIRGFEVILVIPRRIVILRRLVIMISRKRTGGIICVKIVLKMIVIIHRIVLVRIRVKLGR